MRKLAVVGQPVSHSRSPAMQTAALAELGLAAEWSYEAIELSPEDFPGRVRELPRQGFAGVNVTVPHKVAALSVATKASPSATSIGAANTLTFSDGAITAENTDATGILAALGGSPAGRRALVLGAGGSARAAVWALVDGGADVWVWNRTPERAATLAGELNAGVLELGGDDELPLGDFDLLVNATTVGLDTPKGAPGGGLGADPDRAPSDLKALHIGADALRTTHEVVDLVYGAGETPLATAARARGARVVDGLEVLAHQGAASLRIWTGLEPSIETMRRAAREP